ncbi:MAG: TRAP transporter small permease subunit [Alphaproteobacteria bacterium]|nr:MAG: TRAP transporter small permease subunit [Alphaproteobacteria bacterium]
MIDSVLWALGGLARGLVNIWVALSDPGAWLSWLPPFASGEQMSAAQKEALARFIYFGASVEFLFSVLALAILVTVAGLVWRPVLWRAAWGIEALANSVGRVIAWGGLIMVLQQVMIVFLQRIFRVSEITFSPFGLPFTRDLSWWSEELKLYNAAIVALCCAYTFVQGGHVRVDLFYAGMRHRAKRVVDMLGLLLFTLPLMLVIWFYGWFFLWRHMVTPKLSATDTLELMLRKSRLLKDNVETIAFSPNGFDQYWLFKVLMVALAGMMILQAIGFFWRSLAEFLEGEGSADRGLDRDRLEDVTGAPAGMSG